MNILRKILIKILVDNCAAVSIGSSKMMKLIKALVENSDVRVITADGTITSVDDVVEAKFRIGSKDYIVRFQLLNNNQDWLVSFPELNSMGFRMWHDIPSKTSFLVCPNGVVWPLKREKDGCWSLMLAFCVDDHGNVSMEVDNGEEYVMVSEPVFQKVANSLDSVDRVAEMDTYDTIQLGHVNDFNINTFEAKETLNQRKKEGGGLDIIS